MLTNNDLINIIISTTTPPLRFLRTKDMEEDRITISITISMVNKEGNTTTKAMVSTVSTIRESYNRNSSTSLLPLFYICFFAFSFTSGFGLVKLSNALSSTYVIHSCVRFDRHDGVTRSSLTCAL